MIFMKHGPFRTSLNSYQIIEYVLLSYLSVWFALSREASDTGWMNMPCADARGEGGRGDWETEMGRQASG